MKTIALLAALAGATTTFTISHAAAPQDPDKAAKEMAAMMEKMAQFTQPGEEHKVLHRFVGEWTTSMQMFMNGQGTPASAGTATFSWLMPGRWLQSKFSGSMMGRPLESCMIFGYDKFKQSYVTTAVSNMDTAMLTSEGDMTQDGKALITYGTLDEYLTGEHDKMVRYVWRFVSEDEIVNEVHDLPIGETNTKVVEIRFKRKK